MDRKLPLSHLLEKKSFFFFLGGTLCLLIPWWIAFALWLWWCYEIATTYDIPFLNPASNEQTLAGKLFGLVLPGIYKKMSDDASFSIPTSSQINEGANLFGS
jgi:hypothetical protein